LSPEPYLENRIPKIRKESDYEEGALEEASGIIKRETSEAAIV